MALIRDRDMSVQTPLPPTTQVTTPVTVVALAPAPAPAPAPASAPASAPVLSTPQALALDNMILDGTNTIMVDTILGSHRTSINVNSSAIAKMITSSGSFVTLSPSATSTTANFSRGSLTSTTNSSSFITSTNITDGWISHGGKALTYGDILNMVYDDEVMMTDAVRRAGKIKVLPGKRLCIELPKTKECINIDENGKVEDGRMIHKVSKIREFNRYINASDLVEEFIRFIGKLGAKQSEVLSTPLELFINFLVLKAAEEDNDPLPEAPQIESKITDQVT